jgi:ligand-binding sensor domain-containing protein
MGMRCWITIIGLTFATVTYGQQFSLRQYTAIDGLPQSQVNAILEDSYGYLWIGTSGGGLARFDGKEFKVYSTLDGLLSNVVTSLFIDSKQNIWAVHPRGLSRFDSAKEAVKQLNLADFRPIQPN